MKISFLFLGKVYALGRKEYGRLGLGEDVAEEAQEPTLVKTLSDHTCISVNCGTAVSFAVTNKGKCSLIPKMAYFRNLTIYN